MGEIKRKKLNELQQAETPTYTPHHTTEEDWGKAGDPKCPVCGKETVRLLPYGAMGILKACPECIRKRRQIVEYKRRLSEIREVAARERLRLPKRLI